MTCFSKMWLVQNFHKIKVVALTLFIYLVSPVILLLLLCILAYRGIISISAKVSRKDLREMISPSTSFYASDELYGIPNRNVVCCLVLKGQLNIQCLQNIIDKKILSVRNSNGTYKYSHLRMYPSKFQKFLFWKLEEEFEVGNHVMMYDKARDNNRIWTETDVYEIQKNLIRKQWTRFYSPWEILVIPNYRTQSSGTREVKTVLCVRFHMCIGNEVSWMKLLVKILCDRTDSNGNGGIGDPCETDVPVSSLKCTVSSFPPATFIATLPSLSTSSSPSFATSTHKIHMADVFGNFKTIPIQTPLRETQRKLSFICRRILQKLAIPFRIPFDFAEQILEPLSSNEWHVAETSLLKRDHVVLLDRFSVQHVKEIKKMLGVTFSSVLTAALSSALRVTFMEAGLKVPTHMKVLLPLNCSGNGNSKEKERCNDGIDGGSLCWINLPLGVSSSRERLLRCEEEKKKLYRSTKLLTNRVLIGLAGMLPFKYHSYFLRQRPWTGVMMNLKGPSDVLSICDHQIEDFIVSSASDSGFVLGQYLRISLTIDHCLLPNEVMAKNLLKNIYAELVLLGIDGAVAV